MSDFLVGLIVGLVGIISFLFIKNKKYQKALLSAIILWFIFIFCILVRIFLNYG